MSCHPLARYTVKSHFYLERVPCRNYHFHIKYLSVTHPHGAFIAVLSVPISRLTASSDIRHILGYISNQGLVYPLNDQFQEHSLS